MTRRFDSVRELAIFQFLVSAIWVGFPMMAVAQTNQYSSVLDSIEIHEAAFYEPQAEDVFSPQLQASPEPATQLPQPTVAQQPAHAPGSTNAFRSQGSFERLVTIDTGLSGQLLDFQNRQTDKQLILLNHGCFAEGGGARLIPGLQLRASFLAATTNTDGKFPYLGRFPTDFTGDSATDARLLHGNVSMAAHFGSWTHGYFETLFSDVFSFPTFEQGSFQVRQAYVTVGNLNVSPFYLFIGKKTVGFGDMGTLNPFSQAMNWHYFAALHEGAGVGYFCNGVNINATALNGGRGMRVADSNSIGQLNNFAGNISVSRRMGPCSVVRWGAGYLHGTIYDSAVPEHINPNQFGNRNPAWDINTKIRFGNVHVAAEISRTLERWPATNRKVTAYRIESGLDGYLAGHPSRLSVSWSEGIQGPVGSEFEYNRQLVLGCGVRLSANSVFTAEYVNSSGFAPLINIATVSDRSVRQHSAVLGLVLSL